jgi:hypothetical protein
VRQNLWKVIVRREEERLRGRLYIPMTQDLRFASRKFQVLPFGIQSCFANLNLSLFVPAERGYKYLKARSCEVSRETSNNPLTYLTMFITTLQTFQPSTFFELQANF